VALAAEIPAGIMLLLASLRILAPDLIAEVRQMARTVRPAAGS
jgi:hypothetical protein